MSFDAVLKQMAQDRAALDAHAQQREILRRQDLEKMGRQYKCQEESGWNLPPIHAGRLKKAIKDKMFTGGMNLTAVAAWCEVPLTPISTYMRTKSTAIIRTKYCPQLVQAFGEGILA